MCTHEASDWFINQKTMCAGGHINPAISLAFMLAKKISVQRFLTYVVMQLLGAITGSALVFAVSDTVKACFLLPA